MSRLPRPINWDWVELGGSVDEDLCVEVFRTCDAFVGGCTAGDNDDTRVDTSLQSADTESARDCKRASVSC